MNNFSYHFYISSFSVNSLIRYITVFYFQIHNKYSTIMLNLFKKFMKIIVNRSNYFSFYNNFNLKICFKNNYYKLFLFKILIVLLAFGINFNWISNLLFFKYVNGWVFKYIFMMKVNFVYFYHIYLIYKLFYLFNLNKISSVSSVKKFFNLHNSFILPIKKLLFTFLKSPNIFKKAREQYLYTNFKQIINTMFLPMKYNLFSSNHLQFTSNVAFKIRCIIRFICNY